MKKAFLWTVIAAALTLQPLSSHAQPSGETMDDIVLEKACKAFVYSLQSKAMDSLHFSLRIKAAGSSTGEAPSCH